MAYLLEKVGCWIHLLLLSYDLFMSWNLVVRFYRIIFTNFSTYLFKIVMLSWFSWSEWCILLSSQRCLVLWFFPKDRLQLHLGSAYPFISENARRQGRLLLFVHSKAHLGGGVGFIRMCHYGNRDRYSGASQGPLWKSREGKEASCYLLHRRRLPGSFHYHRVGGGEAHIILCIQQKRILFILTIFY
jgi:hypothetical protein